MTKFTLSTYLMVSVLIILSGVLWTLFTQVDRSYEYPIFSPDLQREQSEIIERIYQIKSEAKADVAAIIPEIKSQPSNETATIEPVFEPQVESVKSTATLTQKNNYNDLWSTFPSSDYESYYYLKNNPWSPDYKPGY